MTTVTFRFYEELNDFLPPARRKREFDVRCDRGATIRNVIEALGVPHTGVELVLVNGESVGYERRLRDGDRVAVYPKFETFDVTPLLRVRPRPLRTTRFLADARLGGLARLLRLLGFDTRYEGGGSDARLEAQARDEGRIVLTRDPSLLERRGITHGCLVHATRPREQLREIVEQLDLRRSARPFTRCLACNGDLAPAEESAVAALPPPRVRDRPPRSTTCRHCGRVYREGSRWLRLKPLVDSLVRTADRTA